MILSIAVYFIIVAYTGLSVFYIISNNSLVFFFETRHFLFYGGGLLYLIMRIFVGKMKDFFMFMETYQHETTHLFFALLTFKKVFHFTATARDGGQIKTHKMNPIIALSPYTIPLYTIIIGLFSFIIKAKFMNVLLVLAGFTFFQFLYTAFKDIFTVKQTDLHVYPAFLSYALVFVSMVFYIIFTYLVITYSLSIFADIPLYIFKTLTN